MSETSMTTRRRPLSTCGASALAMARNVYRRSVELKGPIGSVTRRVAKLGSVASPMIHMLQYHWLVLLSLADDHIIWIEKIIECYFRPSRHIFNKVDNVVDKVENFPRKFDDAMNQFPVLLHKIPFLDWAVIHAIKWLEFVISALVIWGLDHGAKEKEINVDTNFNEQNKNDPRDFTLSSSISSTSNANNTKDSSPDVRVVVPTLKCSYKEALEKGVGKDVDIDEAKKEYDEEDEDIEGAEMDDMVVTNDDPLLELFEFGWQTPNPRFTMSRSASYT